MLPSFMIAASHEHMSNVTGIDAVWKKIVAGDLQEPEAQEHSHEQAVKNIDRASSFADDLETMMRIANSSGQFK